MDRSDGALVDDIIGKQHGKRLLADQGLCLE
jgi:hypothetical protein